MRLGYVSAISEQDLEHIDRATYAGTTLIGKLGVESAYERPLHGKNGYREILVNAQGRSVQREGAFVPDLHSQAPDRRRRPGAVDRPGDAAGRGGRARRSPRRGGRDRSEPTATCWRWRASPGFDPAAFARGLSRSEYAALADNIDKPLFNRALRGTYPSGSTIKPVIALAALTYHVVDPSRQEFCAGVFHLPGSAALFREGKGGKHGYVDLEQAIARSCDVYFYGLAATIGVEHIAEFLAPFGYGPAHRHRHQRREARPAALARVEDEGLQAPAGPGLVSGRDRELRRRPGLPAGDAAAARARRRGAGRARQELPAAPGHRRARPRGPREADCAGAAAGRSTASPMPPGTWCCAA